MPVSVNSYASIHTTPVHMHRTMQGSGKPLLLSQIQSDGRSITKHLMDKHPKLEPLRAQALYVGSVRSCLNHPVAFANISADVIRKNTQQMSGSTSPSGLDVSSWKRICFSFSRASSDLGVVIALLCKRLYTEYVDPARLEALVSG